MHGKFFFYKFSQEKIKKLKYLKCTLLLKYLKSTVVLWAVYRLRYFKVLIIFSESNSITCWCIRQDQGIQNCFSQGSLLWNKKALALYDKLKKTTFKYTIIFFLQFTIKSRISSLSFKFRPHCCLWLPRGHMTHFKKFLTRLYLNMYCLLNDKRKHWKCLVLRPS